MFNCKQIVYSSYIDISARTQHLKQETNWSQTEVMKTNWQLTDDKLADDKLADDVWQ